MTYWLAADVVMVMSVVMSVVQHRGELVAEGVVVVAAGQTVETGLLARLVAHGWERWLVAT